MAAAVRLLSVTCCTVLIFAVPLGQARPAVSEATSAAPRVGFYNLAVAVTSTVWARPTAATAASPGVAIPKKATYVGRTSQKLVAAIFVSHNGTRVGFTIFVTLRCTNGTTVRGNSWSTEGKWFKDYWIRPKRDGSFGLNDGNTFATADGRRGEASGRFKGRLKTAKLATGTFRGHVDYRSAAGDLLYSCDTGPLTWSARR